MKEIGRTTLPFGHEPFRITLTELVGDILQLRAFTMQVLGYVMPSEAQTLPPLVPHFLGHSKNKSLVPSSKHIFFY
jgi:hypothetical protein